MFTWFRILNFYKASFIFLLLLIPANIFLNLTVNSAAVVHTAMVSAMGSAINTALALSSKKCGRIKISGISSSIFLNIERKIAVGAWFKATRLYWQATCTPNIADVHMKILSASAV